MFLFQLLNCGFQVEHGRLGSALSLSRFCATDLVHRLARELDDVERVEGDACIGSAGATSAMKGAHMSIVTMSSSLLRSGPSSSKKAPTVFRERPSAIHTGAPVRWLATTVRYS